LADDPVTCARLAQVRARNEFHGAVPSRSAELLVDAATGVRTGAPGLAAELVIEALRLGHYAIYPDTLERAAELLGRLSLPPDHPLAQLLSATAVLAELRRGTTMTHLPSLAATVRKVDLTALGPEIGLLHVHAVALRLIADNPQRAFDESDRIATVARKHGLLGGLPHMLLVKTEAAIALGQLSTAIAVGNEALRLAEQTGQQHAASSLSAALAHTTAWIGDVDSCMTFADAAARHGRDCRADSDTVMAVFARSLLDLGLGRYDTALRRWENLTPDLLRHPVSIALATPDWIEAAVRSSETGRARTLLDRYEIWAHRHQGLAARAVAHRCRALTGTDDDAAHRFETALRLHRADPRPLAQARTELAYGEWLRRARRPGDARPLLHSALDVFTQAGALRWAARARAELRAAGGTVAATPDSVPLTALTPQELEVARLAATGRTNREIGTRLFLSPRTVGYHLHKIYTKLGITGRHELGALGLAVAASNRPQHRSAPDR